MNVDAITVRSRNSYSLIDEDGLAWADLVLLTNDAHREGAKNASATEEEDARAATTARMVEKRILFF